MKTFLIVGALTVSVLFLMVIMLVLQTGSSLPFFGAFNSFLSLDSTQIWWYVTRSAGLMSYILIWLSVVWGLAVSSKIFDPLLERIFTFDFHEYLSLLGLGFVGVHVLVLMLDQYQPFTALQILIPFIAPYRPFWTGLGVIAFYISLLVTLTFYMRSMMSSKLSRAIHMTSLLAYFGATLHGIFGGTDASLPFTQIVYAVTFLITLFLVIYWLMMMYFRKRESEQKALELARQRRKASQQMRARA